MIDMYEGTLGTFFNREEVTTKLMDYMINSEDSLCYEVLEDKTKVIIITGKNKEEEELPEWQHPIIFTDVRGDNVIAINIIPYMKASLDDIITISEKLRDTYNGQLQLHRLIFNKVMLDDSTNELGFVKPALMEAFSNIITTIIGMLLYDESIKYDVEVISKLHFISMDMDDVNDIRDLINKLPRATITKLMHGDLKATYGRIVKAWEEDKLILPSSTIGSLTHNLKAIIPNGRGDGLTVDILIQALSRGFFSLNSKELAIGMVEHLPTFCSIFIAIVSESINSKSSFRKIINSNKRNIKPNDVTRSLLNIINDNIA